MDEMDCMDDIDGTAVNSRYWVVKRQTTTEA